MKRIERFYQIPVLNRKSQPDRPIRLLFLSDFHNDAKGEKLQRLWHQIRKIRPELILCGGDMLTAKAGLFQMDSAAELIRHITKTAPVYAVDGNHEKRLSSGYSSAYREWKKILADAGVHCVDGERADLQIAGMDLCICGASLPLECYHRRRPRPVTDDMKPPMPDETDKTYCILLAHHPDSFETYARWGADLTLSGHIHGGIVRLPFLGGVVGATFKPFPRYDRGCFLQDQKIMIVSAGMGNHTIRLRVCNPAELTVIDLLPNIQE